PNFLSRYRSSRNTTPRCIVASSGTRATNPHHVFTASVRPTYSSVRARYNGFREYWNGPDITMVVAGSPGLTLVPAACIVRRPHRASATAVTLTARPTGSAIAHRVIGHGANSRTTTTRRKAPA